MATRYYRRRRGLSTIVGAIFMILVMVGALNLTLWTLQQQDKVTQAVVEKTNTNLSKLGEDIEVSNIRVDNNLLNLTIANEGGSAAVLKSIYVVNETASTPQQYRYDIDIPVDGRETVPGIGQAGPAIVIKNDTNYSIRVVTESGDSVTTRITSLSTVDLPMALYVIPPTVSPGNNVTALYTVTSNLTDSNLGWAVTPVMQASCSGCTLTQVMAPSSGPTTLTTGNTVMFKWTYRVESPDQLEHKITFNASLTNAKQGNFVIENALAKMVDSAQISYTSEIVVSNDLIQKPEIFLILPGPFGDSGDQGLWGVVVVNPTNQTMDINRVVISMYSSQAAANQQFIEKDQCPRTQIYPTSNWDCPLDNMLEWKNVASPEQIAGFAAKSFLVRSQPGKLTSGPASAFMLSVGVYSSLGQFTKTGLSSSMSDTALSLGNVYLTNTTIPANAVQTPNIIGHVNGLSNDTNVILRIVAADFDTSTSTQIKNGTRLIITVPRGFTEVSVNAAESTGFITNATEPKIIPYSDGTTQIIATMNSALGGASVEAKILSFTAKTPVVNGTRVFIMHVLADGETSTNWSVSPLAQIALQVKDTA